MNTLEKAGLLQMLPKMNRINAMECSITFSKTYNQKIDWHEFSYYLDELRAKGILETAPTQYRGMTEYRLNA